MNFRKKPLALAVILALSSCTVPLLVQAQTTVPQTEEEARKAEDIRKAAELARAEEARKAADAARIQQVDAITITGIRASLQKSIEVKRDSGANIEVITAEDVGKMPDKNLADSLQRLAGVAVRTDYDEAEKVSLRGTNPDMSLILFNGHTVSGGDWFIADQGSSSRSTSLS